MSAEELKVAGCGLRVASPRLAVLGELLVWIMLGLGLEQWASIRRDGWQGWATSPEMAHLTERTERPLKPIFISTRPTDAATADLNFADSSQRPQSPIRF